MAFKEYERTASIQQMNARQLRLYISRNAKEANARLKSLDPDTMPDSMKDILKEESWKGHVSNKGTFLAGTSDMSKGMMQKYAEALRDFNFMDTESKYAVNKEYEQNFDRYEAFIKKQASRSGGKYWKQFIDENGSISKEGYQEYKQYLNFIKGIMEDIQSYSYDAIREKIGVSNVRKRFTEAKKSDDPQRLQKVEKIIGDAYQNFYGKGKSPADLNAYIIQEIAKLDEPKKPKKQTAKKQTTKKQTTKKKAAKKVTAKKSNSKGNNIKAKAGKKMRTHGTVREKQGTS